MLIGLSDFAIGRTMRYYYFRQKSGLFYRTTYAIDSTSAEILVFGSSRANHHYVPEVFEKKLHMSFYNTGRDGNYLLYNYAVFKAITERYTPKIVIFDINPDELCFDNESYERLSSLLPYYKRHPEIHDIIELKSPFEKYKMFSQIYPFNSNLLTIAIGSTELNKTRKSDRKGYVPLFNTLIDTVLHSVGLTDGKLDNNKVNAITNIIKYCRKEKISLLFIHSPCYRIAPASGSSRYVEMLAKKNNMQFLDFSNDDEFLKSPHYFQDQDHLNDTGAVIFSKLVAQKIQDLSL